MSRIDPSCSRCLDGFACREHQSDERVTYLRAGPVSPTGVTPGPWTWFATPHGARVHVGHEVRVADVLSGSNAPTQAGCEANARLIAAAPDLFDALHSLLSALEDVPVAFGVHVHDAIDQCDEALRKALKP